MIDLRDDGTIGIDFDNGAGPVVLPRPKLGLVERQNFARLDIRTAIQALATEIDGRETKPDDAGVAEIRAASRKMVVDWWQATFEGLDVTSKVPADPDDWPAWLVYGPGVIETVTNHWVEVPLARGGTLLPRA
jgi:hypothetical protein